MLFDLFLKLRYAANDADALAKFATCCKLGCLSSLLLHTVAIVLVETVYLVD